MKKKEDFDRVKRKGYRYSTHLFNLMSLCTSREDTRVGIVVGRRFGSAVKRNRAKRIFRELARQTQDQFVMGRDLVIFPKREILSVTHQNLREMWISALAQEGLLRSLKSPPCAN